MTTTIVPEPTIPLEISDVATMPSANGLQGLAYNLSNRAQQRLLAEEVSWTFHLASGRTLRRLARADYAFNVDGKVAPGATESFKQGGTHTQKNPTPVDQITGDITFAEFADGTVVGSDQKQMAAWLADERGAEIRAFQQLLAVLRSQGEDGVRRAINSSSPSDSLAENVLKKILRGLEQKDGLPAAISRVEQGASTKLPRPAVATSH